MKAQKIILIAFLTPLFLFSACEKDGEIPMDFQNLSIDSLKILQTNIPVSLYTDLTFINENVGYAISNFGAIIKTTDGGNSWEQLLFPVSFFLNKIQFTDSQTGYIIGGDNTGGYLLKTDNAGQSWQLIDLNTPDKERPTGMFFISNKTGFISGKKLFRKTTDGGQTWSEVMDQVLENIADVSFKNAGEGYATSDNGKYLKSADGGKTWQSMQSNTSDHLKKIYFAGSKSFAKGRTKVFIDLSTGNKAFSVPDSAFNFLFLDDKRCIGIGQHYEVGFLPYGDIFLTNDTWAMFSQKKYSPQSEAMNVTAIAKVKNGKVLIIGSGTINSTVISLRY
ncbi:MAG: YCF48-related protein [Bacteroidales bacterium]|nr:YCF48-related protein [Bacteroidales bacterium]